jgi:ribosomal protein S18 acetylase RimI-like enzyme
MNIVQDMNKALEVMHNVGSWMFAEGISTSDWWNPNNMNEKFMLQHSEPEEYYVLLINDKPAASVILQDNERNLSWEVIDGQNTQKSLYVHWLAVHRDFAGQKLSHKLLDFAIKKAKEQGLDKVRLDTNADSEILMNLYKDYGFKIRGIEPYGDGHRLAYFELKLD